jgi:hypothetical protein
MPLRTAFSRFLVFFTPLSTEIREKPTKIDGPALSRPVALAELKYY